MGSHLEIRKNNRGQLVTCRVDDDGNVIAYLRVAGEPTGLPEYLSTDDPREYAKRYYRNIRRYRQGRRPRLPDIE
jgi:hypothetical protein